MSGVRLIALILVMLAIPLPTPAQDRPRVTVYAGRTLVDVLQELNRQGLLIVFSTSLVRPNLRVSQEPSGGTLREVLDQVLRPYGLQVRVGPRQRLIVARAPKSPEAASVPATAAGTLRGRVVDADTGQPLADVLVVANLPPQRATTDRDGRFELAGVASGRQSLFVSLVGYVLARPEVDVAADGSAEVVVPLTAGAGAYTEQLTVRAGNDSPRAATPSRFTVGSAELQELRGVLADDPIRAIQALPNAATGDDFRAEFSVRGSAFRQMGFAIDGLPAPWLVHSVQAVDDTATIAMLNADVVDEVTLSSGAMPQSLGNRTGAWLEATLREGSRDAFRLSGSLSGTGASAVAEGPLGGAHRGSWLASIRQSYIDWLIRQLDTQEQTSFGFTDAQAKLVFDLSPRHQLQVTGVAGRSKMDEQDETPSINGVRIGRSSTAMAIAGLRSTLGSSVLVTQRTAWSGRRFRNTTDFHQEVGQGREWTWSYRMDAAWAPRPAVTFDAGTAIDRDWATQLSQQFGSSNSAAPTLRGWQQWNRQRWRQGGYVRGRLTPAAAFVVDGGLRLDRESRERRTTTSPWLLARWTPTARLSLGAGAGEAYQLPDLAQLPAVDATTSTVAERARYLDVSAEYRITPAVTLEAAAYRRLEHGALRHDGPAPRLINGVVFSPLSSGLWMNALDTRARGVEVTARRTAPGGLVGWISYAYGRTRNTELASSEEYWGDFDQRHLLNVFASYRIGTRTNASAKLRIGSNMPVLGYFQQAAGLLALAEMRNELRLPAYARLDLRLNRTYNYTKRRLTLFAEVLNVLNRENVGRTDGVVRGSGAVFGFTETLFPLLPSAGIRIDF